MDKTTDKKEVLKIIHKYIERIKKNNISFDHIYLYGSYAKGTPDEDSDIDLAIIAQDWYPDIFDAQVELMKIGWRIDTRLEPHPFRASDFNPSNPYVRQIIETGNLIL